MEDEEAHYNMWKPMLKQGERQLPKSRIDGPPGKELLLVFPTPIAKTNIGRSLTEREMYCISNISLEDPEKSVFHTKGGSIGKFQSEDYDIFDKFSEELKDIKVFCDREIKQYLEEVEGIDTDQTNLKITQSWLNKVQPGGYHTLHNHRNSYLSGVFYIKCVPDDNIMFNNKYRKINPSFEFPKKVTTPTNNDVIQVKVEEGDLILFNSLLPHAVMPNETEDIDRISLSFDTFPTYLPSLYPPFK